MAKKKQQKPRGSKKRTPKPQGLPWLRWALWGVVVCSVIGGALSLYATQIGFEIAQNGLSNASGCSINDWINCDAAQASSYANLFGIPVAWWGFLFYLFAALAALYALMLSNVRATHMILLTVLLAAGAVLFSLYKATHLYKLGVLCPTCVAMYGVNVAILGLLIAAFKEPIGQIVGRLSAYIKSWFGWPSGLLGMPVVLALAVFAFGYMGMRGYLNQQGEDSQLDMDFAVAAHFRQTPKTIEMDSTASYWGNPNAKVTLVDFADFQCPGCKEAAFHLKGILYEFKDEVKLVYINYPLDSSINRFVTRQVHPQAGPAALAGVCANNNGDFWPYHDEVFRNQTRLSEDFFLNLAEAQGWDRADFQACMAEEETLQRVRRDIELGAALEINSTPSLYINGRYARYWKNSEFLRRVIRMELSANQ